MYINHINKYNNSQEIQDALDAGTLVNPYVAMTSAGTLDWNSLEPTPPAPVVETRLKITYNFESLEETKVLNDFSLVFTDAGDKAEFPDGTEFVFDPWEEYEDFALYYTPSTTGIASVYYTFTGDEISVEDMGMSMFGEDGDIPVVSIEIPDKVNTIWGQAFAFAAYSAITLPNHAMEIKIGAFCCGVCDCGSLVSINNGANTIPAGSSIGEAAFAYQALESITIGSGVTFDEAQDDGQFSMCPNLTAVTFLDTTPPTVYHNTFDWDSNFHIYVPVGSEQAYVSSFNTDLAGEEGYTASVVGTGEIGVVPV